MAKIAHAGPRLLAPVDFSASTGLVLEQAARLAKALDGEIAVLHVAGDGAEDAASSEARVGELVQDLDRSGVRALPVVDHGVASETILEQAERLSADYIVMGSHGEEALYDIQVGSVASAVLSRSRVPVVLVPVPLERERSESPGGP